MYTHTARQMKEEKPKKIFKELRFSLNKIAQLTNTTETEKIKIKTKNRHRIDPIKICELMH